MSAGFGTTSPPPFAHYDPASLCWRTSEDCLPLAVEGYSGKFSGTWPRAGMTRNGSAYELPMSGHRMGGSVSLLLLTPEANTESNQHPDKRRAGGHSVNLQDVAECELA